MTPQATTGAAGVLAAKRARNVQRAEQRIQQGRAYTQRTLNTLQRADVSRVTIPRNSVPFGPTAAPEVEKLHQQIHLQSLRNTLNLIKQHRAAQQLATVPRAYATM